MSEDGLPTAASVLECYNCENIDRYPGTPGNGHSMYCSKCAKKLSKEDVRDELVRREDVVELIDERIEQAEQKLNRARNNYPPEVEMREGKLEAFQELRNEVEEE